MDRLAGLFGKGGDTPVDANAVGLPGVSTSGTMPAPPVPPAAESGVREDDKAADGKKTDDGKKKRGFWSRLFGVGKDGDKKDDTKDDKKKKPGGGG